MTIFQRKFRLFVIYLLLHVILDVSHVQRIRDFFVNALCKCSFYLLTYLLTLGIRLSRVHFSRTYSALQTLVTSEKMAALYRRTCEPHYRSVRRNL